jgi:cation:H+ antiporter
MSNVFTQIQRLHATIESAANIQPLWAVAIMVVGFVLLVYGGNALVLGSASIARRLGISPLVVGLTIVAAGTSAPELFLNLAAALSGETDICFGNIVGSNIANIGLVLAVGGLIAPLVVSRRVVMSEIPWMIGVSCAFAGFLLLHEPGEAAGIKGIGRPGGILFLSVFVILIFVWIRLARSAGETVVPDDIPAAPLPLAILALIAGLLLLPVGGEFARAGAVGLATYFQWPTVVIGLTIVALATSLPELFTTIACCRRGESDMAIGNVVGSNLFNLVLVMGLTATVKPVPLPPGGWIDIGVMLGLSVVLLPLAFVRLRINRVESILLLTVYGGYIGFQVWRALSST